MACNLDPGPCLSATTGRGFLFPDKPTTNQQNHTGYRGRYPLEVTQLTPRQTRPQTGRRRTGPARAGPASALSLPTMYGYSNTVHLSGNRTLLRLSKYCKRLKTNRKHFEQKKIGFYPDFPCFTPCTFVQSLPISLPYPLYICIIMIQTPLYICAILALPPCTFVSS